MRAASRSVASSPEDGGVEFELTLPFLPFYVPKEARPALDLVPLEEELNRFRLQGLPASASETFVLSVDGKTAGAFTRAELARGVDLALLDNAPWAEAGRTLWEAAQYRWKEHFEAWRVMGLQKPVWMMPGLPSFEPHAGAQRAYAEELGRSLQGAGPAGDLPPRLAAAGGGGADPLAGAVADLPAAELRRGAAARDDTRPP